MVRRSIRVCSQRVAEDLAVSLVGPVIGIGGQCIALPLGVPGPLAGLVGTKALGLHTGIRQKKAPALDQADFTVCAVRP